MAAEGRRPLNEDALALLRGAEALEPVRRLPGERDEEEPQSGTGLCLSGGGYRAMLFHAGALWRLLETGWLMRLDRISSVSGGSLAAARLALAWDSLELERPGASERFASEVVEPLRRLAGKTIDVPAMVSGLLLPGTSIGQRLASAYRRLLLSDRAGPDGSPPLTALPTRPLFIINATNVGSAALWRFTREYMADWRVGRVERPHVDLAAALACSSAFPPMLSPYALDLTGERWESGSYELGRGDYRRRAMLSDGGVYDNLGLETVYKRCRTVIVSDAGRELAGVPRPARDWLRHIRRVSKIVDDQVRSLRKRQLRFAYDHGLRDGAYFGIRSNIESFELPDALPCPLEQTARLSEIPTRLKRVDPPRQERLVNWGYAVCDAALRKHLDVPDGVPPAFPYPEARVG